MLDVAKVNDWKLGCWSAGYESGVEREEEEKGFQGHVERFEGSVQCVFGRFENRAILDRIYV